MAPVKMMEVTTRRAMPEYTTLVTVVLLRNNKPSIETLNYSTYNDSCGSPNLCHYCKEVVAH